MTFNSSLDATVKLDNGEVLLDNTYVDRDDHAFAQIPAEFFDKLVDLVLLILLEELTDDSSRSVLVRLGLNILLIKLKSISSHFAAKLLATIGITDELISRAHSAAIGIDGLNDTCGLTWSQTGHIREKRLTMSTMAESRYLASFSGGRRFWHGWVLHISCQSNTVPGDRVQTWVLSKRTRAVLVQAGNLVVDHHNLQWLGSVVIGVRVLELGAHEAFLVDNALQVANQLGCLSRPTTNADHIRSTTLNDLLEFLSLTLISGEISKLALFDHSSIFLYPSPANRIAGWIRQAVRENQDTWRSTQDHTLGLIRRLVKSFCVLFATHLEHFILTESSDNLFDILCDDFLQFRIGNIEYLLAFFSPLLSSIAKVLRLKLLVELSAEIISSRHVKLDGNKTFLLSLHHLQEEFRLVNQVGDSLVLQILNFVVGVRVVDSAQSLFSSSTADLGSLVVGVSEMFTHPWTCEQLFRVHLPCCVDDSVTCGEIIVDQAIREIHGVLRIVVGSDLFALAEGVLCKLNFPKIILVQELVGADDVFWCIRVVAVRISRLSRHLNFVNDKELEDLAYSFAEWALEFGGKTLLRPQLRPVVVFTVAKDGLHIIQGVLVQIGGISDTSNDAIPRSSNLGIFPLLFQLFGVFREILLDKVVELVCLTIGSVNRRQTGTAEPASGGTYLCLRFGSFAKLFADQIQIIFIELRLFLAVAMFPFSFVYRAHVRIGVAAFLLVFILIDDKAFADLNSVS
ncbi:hypothetical protein HG530_006276 [Fusarium avenaceum]|nr:hypothetical protein HG530_006276 [Fusarium avenaceum]